MNEKNYAPEIERCPVNENMSFSINPQDTYQEWHKPLRLEVFHEKMSQMLMSKFPLKDYFYFFRVELSHTGRLHLHGLLRCLHDQARLDLYTHKLRELEHLASFKLDTFDAEEDTPEMEKKRIWERYCYKQMGVYPPAYRHLGEINQPLDYKGKFIFKFQPEEIKEL